MYACVAVICAGTVMALLMYFFNDNFRDPQKEKNIKEWKISLKSGYSHHYFDMIRTSLVLSLSDSSYFALSDSSLVELLLKAETVSVTGYVPQVTINSTEYPVEKRKMYAQEEYFAVIIDGLYVLIADRNYTPVWGTRPVDTKVVPSPQIKALRTPQKYSLRLFYFLSMSPSG